MGSKWSVKSWFVLVITLASISGISSANSNVMATPDLPPACSSSTKESLRREIYELTKQQAGSAWELVQTFLCVDKNTALRTFEKAHTASIRFRIAGPTAVEERPLNDISNELEHHLPAGKAWGPSARKEEDDLVIYYSINDTCWEFFGLRFVDKKWQLVTLGGGCD